MHEEKEIISTEQTPITNVHPDEDGEMKFASFFKTILILSFVFGIAFLSFLVWLAIQLVKWIVSFI